MASVGGDMAGDDRDDFGVGELGSHTTNGTCRSRSSRSSENWNRELRSGALIDG